MKQKLDPHHSRLFLLRRCKRPVWFWPGWMCFEEQHHSSLEATLHPRGADFWDRLHHVDTRTRSEVSAPSVCVCRLAYPAVISPSEPLGPQPVFLKRIYCLAFLVTEHSRQIKAHTHVQTKDWPMSYFCYVLLDPEPSELQDVWESKHESALWAGCCPSFFVVFLLSVFTFVPLCCWDDSPALL